ncbi:Lysophospholipase L1 or related esterase Includes spore coat protein LipC/YcsK [Cupriavidus necator]|uniref:Arylesterase protein n=1 Tax=Cupriavidus necator (strain ATCC 17699 / DSM 428 / KCTC 22496 / NCIMB 10442 / H16 / Stanier 337) TaxID=381666 RepID=Q0K9V0_CUPNH|nr:SGNH/GDSL hydrolase family protein [Cupriavidus necator]QCC01038.1 GDSL family lipase [Cupriavidus necator H16]QQB76135.1 SGNH/GDSL hydrolase family protein [Cupriavidus necator]WKA39412.1 SGNH/GDSL hydrolase family protein [Cupriavidus necator]CAJ93221.1 Arylesterase protein [Cupriavidus necator H16]
MTAAPLAETDPLQILVYADSLSWGIVPGTRRRLPFPVRWPGRLELGLNADGGAPVRVIEDCLNGRRTVWDDPFKPGRNGLHGLAQRVEIHSPLALVVLMLGNNDFQSMHPHNAWHAAQGIATLVQAIRSAPIEPGMPVPPVLVVTPPPIRTPRGPLAPKFAGGEHKWTGLPQAVAEVCTQLGCPLFDAGTVIQSSEVDGVHLDADAHLALGDALRPVVRELLRG